MTSGSVWGNAPVASRKNASETFNADLPPVLGVAQGEMFIVETNSVLTGVQMSKDEFEGLADFDAFRIPVTGPIHVRNVNPGDVVRVDVHFIEIADEGAMVTLVGRGAFTRPLMPHGRWFRIVNNFVEFNDHRIPTKPMVGKIGVGVAGESPSSSTVGRHGGNMDCTDIGPGSSVLFPVQVSGAQLFAGDLHACQGDGEASVTAVEVEGRVGLSCRVIDGVTLRRPFILTDDRVMAVGDGADLDEAVRVALDDMLEMVSSGLGWSYEDTAMFLSAAADVRVCQVANPRIGARVSLASSFCSFMDSWRA